MVWQLLSAAHVVCRCSARLGSYNWAGIQSNSGVWMNPAFQLHLARLDLVNHEENPILSIRQPKI